MLRRTDILITQVRRQSENTDFSDTTGIGDDEIIQYLNDAQHMLQSGILQQHPRVFSAESIQNTVARQESYSLPSDAYIGNKVTNVEYSSSGNDVDYIPLRMGNLKNRASGDFGDPIYYIRQGGNLLLSPVPDSSSATLRITYVKRVNQVDTRRGIISSVTTSGNSVTNLVGDLSSSTALDITALSAAEYICIVDAYGNIKMKNLPIMGIDSSTGALTIDPSFAFESGESIAVGDYIVIGKNTSTHSEFDPSCERFLITYADIRCKNRDSSVDAAESNELLANMTRDIAASYAEIDDDVIEVPIISEW